MRKKLGVIGGVGALASLYFIEMLIKKTKVKCDQDYIDFILFNHASIPDRTSYILDNSLDSPLPYLKEDILKLESLGCDYICIPCNTSFYFEKEINNTSSIPVYNILEETVKYVKEKYNKVLLLSTQGTLKSGLYQKYLHLYNMDYVCLNDEIQSHVNEIIYDEIKVNKKVDFDKFNKVIEYGKALGCDSIILGCTQLSMIKSMKKLEDYFVDPLELMVDKVLDEFGKEKL